MVESVEGLRRLCLLPAKNSTGRNLPQPGAQQDQTQNYAPAQFHRFLRMIAPFKKPVS